ncbi:hypothetical protein [Brucepastera parasyntrophica]|nr:hypothetical protein [Brucepastera parasyntrophica]
MKEIEANMKAWSLLAEDHYKHFKKSLQERDSVLSGVIEKELGDI